MGRIQRKKPSGPKKKKQRVDNKSTAGAQVAGNRAAKKVAAREGDTRKVKIKGLPQKKPHWYLALKHSSKP